MNNRYLKAFEAVKDRTDLSTLIGNILLVEMIADEHFEKKVQTETGATVSLIMAQSIGKKQVANTIETDRPTFARVLACGRGYDDGALEAKPGTIILAGAHAFKQFSVYGKVFNYGDTRLAFVQDSEIQQHWPNQQAFDEYFNLINAALQGQ